MSSLAGPGDLLPAPIPAVNLVMLANSPQRADELCACDWNDFRGLQNAELGLALGPSRHQTGAYNSSLASELEAR